MTGLSVRVVRSRILRYWVAGFSGGWGRGSCVCGTGKAAWKHGFLILRRHGFSWDTWLRRKNAALSIAARCAIGLSGCLLCLRGAELDDFPRFARPYPFHFRSRLEATGNVKRNDSTHILLLLLSMARGLVSIRFTARFIFQPFEKSAFLDSQLLG